MTNFYVLDTNVIVSAVLFPNSLPRKAFELALVQGKVLLSTEVIGELNEVIIRPKFDRYVSLEKREVFLQRLVQDSILVDVQISIKDCRDPKDNKFLELAVDGEATMIVSGDRDLLILHPFREIPILRIDQFLDFQI